MSKHAFPTYRYIGLSQVGTVHKRDRTFTSTTRRRLGAGNAFPKRFFATAALSGSR